MKHQVRNALVSTALLVTFAATLTAKSEDVRNHTASAGNSSAADIHGPAASHENVIFQFLNNGTGWGPGGIVADAKGNLYGVTGRDASNGYNGLAYELSPQPGGMWLEHILYTFGAYPADGVDPTGTLVFDGEGNLYGVTQGGGSNDACTDFYLGCGTVFELSPQPNGIWTEKIIYNFAQELGSENGPGPTGVVFDGEGNLYGMTQNYQGTQCDYIIPPPVGCGTVFELSPQQDGSWSEQLIYLFSSYPGDGLFPYGNVVVDSAGNVYGTTSVGGGISCAGGSSAGCGTVFELSPTTNGGWAEKLLHSFGGKPDGSFPEAGLIFDSAGNLYGTTETGGAHRCGGHYGEFGCGIAFELSPEQNGAWSEKIIYDFAKNAGSAPVAPLTFDSGGNLYGTTLEGGTYVTGCQDSMDVHYCGTVFQLVPTANGSWLEHFYRFKGGTSDGAHPAAGVVLEDGRIFGTTSDGDGTVFEVQR